MRTFDSMHITHDAAGNSLGQPLPHAVTVADGAGGYRTFDSTGAFLIGELERLDLTLHEPLAEVSYGRDIDLRNDVTIADEVSSFMLSTYGSQGGLGTGNGIGTGKAWAGKNTTEITGISVDVAKVPQDLHIWSMELKYSIPELESSARAGRPIDQQKYAGLQLKHQMDCDEQAYFGDTTMGDTGLVNNVRVTNVSPVANGAMGTPQWTTKTPDEILADFNTALASVWDASAWAVTPSRVLIPPAQFGYISTQKVSQAGNVSILRYVQENNLLTATGKGKLEIYPAKWCIGTGVGGTPGTLGTVDRMAVYTKAEKYVRWPVTPLLRTPLQYDGLWHKTTYYCRLGVVEAVYPDTIGYFDGI